MNTIIINCFTKLSTLICVFIFSASNIINFAEFRADIRNNDKNKILKDKEKPLYYETIKEYNEKVPKGIENIKIKGVNGVLSLNEVGEYIVKVDKIDEVVMNYQEDKIVIQSLRLDLVVSKVTNLSREKAKAYIGAKLVRVNGLINANNDYYVKTGDVISITKFGRVIVDEVLGTSKKDKIILKIKKTIR